MNLKFNYINTEIEIINEFINCIEIENTNYFYRTVNELNMLSNGSLSDQLYFYDKDYKELNLSGKMFVLIDYFNICFSSKKITSNINKSIAKEVSEEEKAKLQNIYKKLEGVFSNIINRIDLSLNYIEDCNIENIIKIINISVRKKESLIENLLLLIDIEKIFEINKLLVFVNLKQYLNKAELDELYKYSIYNNVNIVLIDSQIYKYKSKYEKKLVISEDLTEFVV